MTVRTPNVATNSLNTCAAPDRVCCEICSSGSPISSDGLTMFPLIGRESHEPNYVTLTEAVAAGWVRITEVSDAGSVPELRVVNDGERPVLIIDGEELVAAKQNRIANITILVSPKKTLTIPVSCVEAERWRSVGREFQPADRAYHANGRRAKLTQVSASMRCGESRAADQGAIWAEIDAKSARLGAQSDTRAAAAMYETRRRSLDDLVQTLEPVEHQVGAVFTLGGAIAGLDVFDSPRTWRSLLPKLVRSYGLDAMDPMIAGAKFTNPEPARFLGAVRAARAQSFPAVGAGTDVRFDSGGVAPPSRTTLASCTSLRFRRSRTCSRSRVRAGGDRLSSEWNSETHRVAARLRASAHGRQMLHSAYR